MRTLRALRLTAPLVALFFAACSDSPTSPGPTPTPTPTPTGPTLTQVQTQIFTPRCAIPACHSGGAPVQGLSLESGRTWAATVGVASTEQPSLRRVAPGEPDQSYLVHKVEGRLGIAGARMPLVGSFLSAQESQLIRDWITNGANNN